MTTESPEILEKKEHKTKSMEAKSECLTSQQSAPKQDPKTDDATKVGLESTSSAEKDAESMHEQAKALYLTRQFQKSADLYSTVIQDLQKGKYQQDEFAFGMANLWFEYGEVLFELAVAESAILSEQKLLKQQPVDEEEEPAEEESAEEPENEEAGDENTAGDVSEDFQASWEALEMSRIIYSLYLPKEWKQCLSEISNEHENTDREKLSSEEIPGAVMKLAEVYLLLADLSLEQENYDQAIRDLTSAFMLKKSLKKALHEALEAGDDHHILLIKSMWDLPRHLAEIHFKMSMAYEYEEKFALSMPEMQAALSIFKKFLDMLKQSLGDDEPGEENKTKGKGKAESAVFSFAQAEDLDGVEWMDVLGKISPESLEKSKKDMESLVPDLELKLEDIKDQMAQARKKPKSALANNPFNPFTFGQQISTEAANVLSAVQVKRPASTAESGSSATNSNSNHADSNVQDLSKLVKKKRTSE